MDKPAFTQNEMILMRMRGVRPTPMTLASRFSPMRPQKFWDNDNEPRGVDPFHAAAGEAADAASREPIKSQP